jgi:hypothetical protein
MYSKVWPRVLAGAVALAIAGAAVASSHKEAPYISSLPKVDGTDFYLFNSYETGRAGYVTFIANYQPFQSTQGGPNYFPLDPDALYEIMVDNNGDAAEELTFQFRFTNTLAGLSVPAGGKTIPVPLQHIGTFSATSATNLNTTESYTLTLVRGDRRAGTATAVTDAGSGSTTFAKPYDNVGNKSVADYAAYANSFIHTINIPGCTVNGAQATGKVFVGQRQDPFFLDLGGTFDLANYKYPIETLYPNYTTPGSARNLVTNSLKGVAVTSLALEVPAACLTANGDPVIGAWTTASVRQAKVTNPVPQSSKSEAAVGPVASGAIGPSVNGGAWTQVSRLGMALVNELIIGTPDKDRWNATAPKDDAQFNDYATNPSFPILLQAIFGGAGVKAPNVYPRADLVEVFATGIPGLNKPQNQTVGGEMLRLNTNTPVVASGSQNDLGVIAGDNAGYPNGRRPIDDIVDITLRVAMGVLLQPYDGSAKDPDPASDMSRQFLYTDNVEAQPSDFLTAFPYVAPPVPGSPDY